jgi:hypothetical protein
MSEANTNLLDAALWLADVGYRVFPCVPGGKAPLTSHGCLDATDDLDQVERWWTDHPTANIGIATDGLLALDIDGPDNPWLSDEPGKQLDLAVGPCSLTANGGRQHLFRQPAGCDWRNTTGKIAPRVDTRGNGGYIVAPPSVLDGGLAYRWQRGAELEVGPGELPEPPVWLTDELDALATGSPTSDRVGEDEAAANPIPAGQRNATLASLAGTMRRVGMSDTEIVAGLKEVNQGRCTPPLPEIEVERIGRSIERYEPDAIATAIAEQHFAQNQGLVTGESVSAPEDPGPLPEHLLRVPGFVSELMDHTLAIAPYPSQVMAFCGALAMQGFLAGRKVRDPGDNRTNLYLLGLAHSSAGKDWPRKVNTAIAHEVGLSEAIGVNFSSGEGIQDALFQTPSMLFQTDEIDGMLQSINKAKDARHESIMGTLLTMYSSANSVFAMRRKAGKEAPGVIDQPCLSFFGTAIPNHYYGALSERMLTNGFFARMIVVEAGKRPAGQEPSIRALPERILEIAKWWADYRPPGARGNLTSLHPSPAVVEHTDAARKVVVETRMMAEAEYAKAEAESDPVGTTVWGRVSEQMRKLALIYAISENHRSPRITEDAATWASRFMLHQTRRMLFMASNHVAENPFHAECLKAIKKLREAPGQQMPHSLLLKRMKIDGKSFTTLMETLIQRGEVQVVTTPRPGWHVRSYQLIQG